MACLAAILFIFAIILFIKNYITYRYSDRIVDAIHKYNTREIDKAFEENRRPDTIPYNCIKSYEAILLDIFDWTDKNIIPKEYYERIKPYL